MADLGSSLQALLQVPGLQELLNQSITQQRQLQPLKTAVTQQALNMLPNGAFPSGGPTGDGGFSRPNVSAIPAANYSTPPPSGIDWSKYLPLILGALSAAAKGGGGGASSGGNLANVVNALKKLFGGGDTGTVKGDTYPNGIPIDPEDPRNATNDWLWGTGTPSPIELPPPTPNVTTSETFQLPGGGGDYSGYDNYDDGDGF